MLEAVAWANSEQELKDFLKQEKSIVEYQDGRFVKAFKMGSPLEYFYPPLKGYVVAVGVPAIEDVGTVDDWVQETIQNFANTQEVLHQV